jgi:hypothetical protein
MLNDVVVGTFVNSYETAEPMDFGWLTTIGACVNLPETKVTVTELLKVTVPTWYLNGTQANSVFN